MANVSQLQPALTPRVQTSSSEAQDKDADFLALRLLNKRARLRLSPATLNLTSFPSKASLFAIVNSKGWFAAVIQDASGASALVLSPLVDLRSALAAASAQDEQPFRSRRRVTISGATPHILTLAYNDTRILLGAVDGSIQVYASDQLFSSGEGLVQPIHVFATSSNAALLSIKPNPGDIPELVAVLRDCESSPGSLAVELLDVQKLVSSGGWMAGKSPSTTPTSISWSPKGKQLALGLQSGDIVTFSPTATATPKSSIPHPPSADNMSVISVHWLSTSSFHTIYAPSGKLMPDVEQVHFHSSFDSKSNSAQDIRFNSPYLPFPGLRPPGEYLVCLRGWDPSKLLLFIGDSTSSDIGLIGSAPTDSGESWYNLSLEETSTPSLPLDKDQNDTILLGMDVDLTSWGSYHHSTASGEPLELPAHPIMYVYASDGTVLGWHVLNVTGKPYPGMVTPSDAPIAAPNMLSVPSMVRELSSDMQTTPMVSPTISTPTEAPEVKPPPTVFGQPSGFGLHISGFGTSGSAFGQPSAFGQMPSGFSQQSTSAFGQPSSFGQPTTTTISGSTTVPSTFGQHSTSAFGSAAQSGGFGAFSSTGTAKFGQTGFGFDGPTQTTTPMVPPSTSIPEESMASDDTPTLRGLGLGGPNSEDADSKPSIFGKVSPPVSPSQQSTEGSLIKPGSGFGAFSGFDQKSPFVKPSAFSSAQSSAMTFGTNAFQSKTESAPSTSSFGSGQSAFGQTTTSSTFGQSAFGQSSFGQLQTGASAFGKPTFGAVFSTVPPTTSTTSTSTSGATSGGFSAFASGTQSAFGVAASKSGPSVKPVWATNDSSEPPKPSPLGSTTNVFSKPTELTESKTPSEIPSKTATSFTVASQFATRDPFTRDDESRSPSPAGAQKEAAPSAFTSSTPGPSSGAFGNLQTTPSAFLKPASGFFGQVPKDSPFFAPKPAESKPTSAFALSASLGTPTSTLPKPTSAQPTFGSSSMFVGTPKSPFPPASTTPAQPSPTITSNAFNAFSGGAGGFAAFASGGNKSFSDLLRTRAEDEPLETKPSETTPTKPVPEPTQTPVSTTLAKSTPEPSQPAVSTTPAREPPQPPTMPIAAPEPEEDTVTVEVKPREATVEPKEKPKEAIPVQEPSLESISSSTSSSFVKVEKDEGGEDEEGEDEDEEDEDEEDEEDEDEDEDEGDDGEWLPSDEPSDSEESEEESERLSEPVDEKARRAEVQKVLDPTEIPLPVTRSPSTTPKAEHPKITGSVSPPPQVPPASVSQVSPSKELGATPPSSPKDTPSAVQIPVSAPKPSPPPTTPFSLAPRPNNRPLRSSPLANTPLVLEGETEKSPPVSKSAPPVAQPATPKAPYGKWTPPPTTPPPFTSTFSTLGEKPAPAVSIPTTAPPPLFLPPAQADSHPKAPMVSSTFPAPGEKPSTAVFTPMTTSAPTPTLFAPADKAPIPTTALMATPGPAGSLFKTPTGFASFPPLSATPSSWGTPLKSAEGTPPPTKLPQTLFGGQPSLLAPMAGLTMPILASPSPSPFASLAPSTSPSLGTASPVARTPVPASTPSPTPEQGMQAECVILLAALGKELESLKQLATAASIKTSELKKTSGIVHEKADLGDPNLWVFGDIEEYGRVLAGVELDVRELKLQRVSLRKALKELDSNILKVNTRREEIARFSKAKTDVDFAKMLKIRTLAPEYSETQSRLRKNIRAIKDRVQKLEDHLQTSKKRISELRTGRPSIRPPTLDTVNRTFRNIDLAIDQQKREVSHLRHRMAQLEISRDVGARDQLTISSSKRPLNVTPNVAITTAAALNAERSAQRLKKALLASRTQPLLNTTATASLVPTSFQTPQKRTLVKPEVKTPDVKTPETGFQLPRLPNTPAMSFPSSLLGWTPPPSSEFASPIHDISPSRNRGVAKHHQKPIMLNKKAASPGAASGPTQPSAFDWKLPVEPIKPASALPFALRPT